MKKSLTLPLFLLLTAAAVYFWSQSSQPIAPNNAAPTLGHNTSNPPSDPISPPGSDPSASAPSAEEIHQEKQLQQAYLTRAIEKQRRDKEVLAAAEKNPQDLGKLSGSAPEYRISSATIDAIRQAQKGDVIALPAAGGNQQNATVFMAENPADHTWLRALKLENHPDAVLTLTAESNQPLSATIMAQNSPHAWQSHNLENGHLFLQKVPRTSIIPDCETPIAMGDVADSPTGGSGGSSGPPGSVPILESLPGATKVLYLDFDGETVNGTQWNVDFTSNQTIHAASPALSTSEMEIIWKEISEDYRPFAVNVTTNRAVYNTALVANRYMVIYTPTRFRSGSRSGSAYINSFGSTFSSVGWVFTLDCLGASYRAVTGSHEAGHACGLYHDGAIAQEYYPGHGESFTTTAARAHTWAPIMGYAAGKKITQWSNTDYPEGQVWNTPYSILPTPQDDTALIAAKLGLRTDDHPDSHNAGTHVSLRNAALDTSTTHALQGEGIISTREENDVFTYVATHVGYLSITATPFSAGATGVNLDLEMQLLDSSGNVITSHSPNSTTSASINQVLQPGTYFLKVTGGARLSYDSFYSDYGSLGCYTLSGQFDWSGVPVIHKHPISAALQAGQTIELLVIASSTSQLNYQWQHKQLGSTAWINTGIDSNVLTITKCNTSHSGAYRVKVTSNNYEIFSRINAVIVSSVFDENTYYWSTFYGNPGGSGNSNGNSTIARFNSPNSIIITNNGRMVIADKKNNKLRVIYNGLVEDLAGGSIWPDETEFRDGKGNEANLLEPTGLCYSNDNFIYFVEPLYHVVRKCDLSGNVTTIAGIQNESGFNDGHISTAKFYFPKCILRSNDGTIYIAEDRRIRIISPQGYVSLLAGKSWQAGYQDGAGIDATFTNIASMAFDSQGNIICADSAGLIRKITRTGQVSTIAGSIFTGFQDGIGIQARFNYPSGIYLDSADNIYVADTLNNKIRKIIGNAVTTISGNLSAGHEDGDLSIAKFNHPEGLHVDNDGKIFITEKENHTIRVIANNTVATLYGLPPNNTKLHGPRGIDLDSNQNIVVANTAHNNIKVINPAGELIGTYGSSSGQSGYNNGGANNSLFSGPTDVAATDLGIFVVDQKNRRIRKIDSTSNIVSNFSGNGANGNQDGTAQAASYQWPTYISYDKEEFNSGLTPQIYIADINSKLIRKVDVSGNVETIFSNLPNGIDGFTMRNNIFYVSTFMKIEKIIANTIHPFLGFGGTNIPNFRPYGIYLDKNENCYWINHKYSIHKLHDSNQINSVIAGNIKNQGSNPGLSQNASFSFLQDLVINDQGVVYGTDLQNNRIIKGTPILKEDDGGGLTSTSQTSDSDNDGQPDLSEILSGTDPYDSGSALKIESASFGTVGPNKTVTLSFPAVQGIIYQIEHSTDLQNWTVVEDLITPTNGVNVINKTITLPPSTKGFVRVAVQEL